MSVFEHIAPLCNSLTRYCIFTLNFVQQQKSFSVVTPFCRQRRNHSTAPFWTAPAVVEKCSRQLQDYKLFKTAATKPLRQELQINVCNVSTKFQQNIILPVFSTKECN
ncbi:hypothetical protein AVEN_146189-1 [Araneus ventricosus]|uniref:Uncharacterized protein n=1 Tax=Araneus ventricosus TaxID=182803 RepID=A0A4Y2CIY9_ARAVE|nr:hypothetical protein AVEN_146189-1 [Araneus ventricosus]